MHKSKTSAQSSKNSAKVINLNKPFTCDHCNKSFAREQTLITHVCEPKRRAQNQHKPEVKQALRAYQLWWRHVHPREIIPVSYQQFAASQLYPAFVKIGAWSLEQQVQEFDAWVQWHVMSQTPVDSWCDVHKYEEYLKHLLLNEDHLQAITRGLLTAQSWSEISGQPWQDMFRKGNVHVLCAWIRQGRISAWMLYNAPSAEMFLQRCSPEQLMLILQVAPSHVWKIRFLRMKDQSDAVRITLQEAGM